MFQRLLIVIAAACLGIAAFLLLRRVQLHRAQKASTEQNGIQLRAGIPHVIYFWSDHCAQCKSVQRPTLERLLEKTSEEDVKLITLRVEDYGDLARSWGVQTLPTTYVLDRQGNVTHVNNGIASESRLLQQLNLATTEAT